MREIEITFTNVRVDEVILEVAEYIKQGYRVRSWRNSYDGSTYRTGCEKHTIELVKD